MKIRISNEAQEKIKAVWQPENRLVLDFEDATGPFVESGASCQLYPLFRLLFVPKEFSQEELAVYDTSFKTELGPIYMKKSSERYLDEVIRLVVEKNYQRLQIVSDSGVLVANLPLKQIELDEKGQWNGKTSRHNGSTC